MKSVARFILMAKCGHIKSETSFTFIRSYDFICCVGGSRTDRSALVSSFQFNLNIPFTAGVGFSTV